MTLSNDRYGRIITQQDGKIDTTYTVTDPQDQGGNIAFTLGFPIGTADERILSAIEGMSPGWYTLTITNKKLTKTQILQKLADLTTEVNNLS